MLQLETLFLIFAVGIVLSQNPASLVVINDAKDLGGMCLDGTPPAYYIAKGSGSGVNKWEFHHEGGGYCLSLGDCYGRSNGDLGSSKNYQPRADLGGGYLSNNPGENPLMYNWNKVYFKYCDGGFFSGNADAMYNNRHLFFRGSRNLRAYFNSLMKDHNLGGATDIVVGGCSAGGIAVYLSLDWWASVLPKSAKVVGLPDSGFCVDYNAPSGNPHFGSDMRGLFDFINSTSGVNQDCIAAHAPTHDTNQCILAEHSVVHIKTPIFPLNSEYDAWQTDNVLGSKDPGQINQFGALITDRFTKSVLANPRNGGFLDSCFHHCGGWSPVIDGQKPATVFSRWYGGGNGVLLSQKPYPCPSCCG